MKVCMGVPYIFLIWSYRDKTIIQLFHERYYMNREKNEKNRNKIVSSISSVSQKLDAIKMQSQDEWQK